MVIVETTKGDVHLGKLGEAQDERARYPHAMAGYIAWLCAQWAHFSAVLPDSWRELRTKARPSLYFLTILSELLTQKKAHLLPTLGTGTPGEGDLLGWYDDGYYYLLPSKK